MKILVDGDWILELFVNRYQSRQDAEKLINILNKQSQVKVYTTEFCLAKIKFFLGKNDLELGKDAVSWVQTILNNRILPFDKNIRDSARNSFIKDFESAVEVACAKQEKIAAIITLNPENFNGASLPILSSDHLQERLLLEQAWQGNDSPALIMGNLQTIKIINNFIDLDYLFTTQAADSEIINEKQVVANLYSQESKYNVQQEIKLKRQSFQQEIQEREHTFPVHFVNQKINSDKREYFNLDQG